VGKLENIPPSPQRLSLSPASPRKVLVVVGVIVSAAAVIWVIMQRFSLGGEALHNDPNDSCGGD